VVCTAQDQCHVVGTCNTETGTCSNPAAPNGTTCNDANACTRTDGCQEGVCRGGNPIVCTAQDQCHVAGTCNTQTGVCSNPAAVDGTTCNDTNACTRTDTCEGGSCRGTNPVVCPDPDQCHNRGTCDPGTGACSNPARVDGTPCNDQNACTRTDTCTTGACTGGNPVVCPTPDQCHLPGTCDPASGICSNPEQPDTTPCNDGDACTQTDLCLTGVCNGLNPVICPEPDECHLPTTCQPSTGLCPPVEKPPRTPCTDDGRECTEDVCTAGLCQHPPRTNGTGCNDGDACTQTDLCQDGNCAGLNPVICPVPDECHLPTTCDPASGLCPPIQKTDGTPCGDEGVPCTEDICTTGVCQHEPRDGRCDTGECILAHCEPGDPKGNAIGCVSDPVNEGETCTDDDYACTDDRCTSGVCQHTTVAARCPSDEPCLPIICAPDRTDPGTSGCLPIPETVAGDECVEDGDPCTDDACAAGSCGHVPVTTKATCDPVGPAYERALALAQEAGTLSSVVTGALPTQVSPEVVTSASLTGSVTDLASGFELIARILAGRAEGPLAPLGPKKNRVPSPLETSAQRRGRMALAQLQQTPKKVNTFLHGLTPARRQGLLSRTMTRDLRRRGATLRRGTKALRKELKRLQRTSGTFTR
jgi:hypothetical protein